MTAIQADLWPDKNSTDPLTVQQDYDKAAQTYADSVLTDGWQSSFDRITPVLQSILPNKHFALPGEEVKVLDAGCGDGLLAERFDFTKFAVGLYGCDLSPEMLQIAN